MKPERHKKPRPPLDAEALERLALFYAGRYATTRAKLRSYLVRKLGERGWEGEGEASAQDLIERLVERFAELGYVNDRAFANAKGASLQRKGFGERRLGQALYAAGIEPADAAEAREQAQAGAFEAALRFAQRKRIGPFAESEPDRAMRAKAFASMIRAGHSTDIARKFVNARAGEVPEPDEM